MTDKEAAELKIGGEVLCYAGMSIQEIAYHLNFSTQSFFGKYFKQHTGTSPSRYKRKG